MFLSAVGLVVLLGCWLTGYAYVALLRERGTRRHVLRTGERATARCVHVYSHPNPAIAKPGRKIRQRFVLEFAGPDGDRVSFEDDATPAATRVGDELTVAYLPAQPDHAVCAPADGQQGYGEPLYPVLVFFLGFLVVMAMVAFAGVAVLQAYASAPPDLWIEP
ncbi:DUF3592 domain-containing protein [Streptomyces sp. V3I8]|uniref:DUF3592 domain-containing protein n=1 Tax=Streptomyces sp. V3I8 TaxID=3042279 RepID=UPI0027D930CD|nr:DUF3592 domain-containing protein [Streptomyces sp. V3I8]